MQIDQGSIYCYLALKLFRCLTLYINPQVADEQSINNLLQPTYVINQN